MDYIEGASWKVFRMLLSSAFQTAVYQHAYSVSGTCLCTASTSLVVVASVLLVFPWLWTLEPQGCSWEVFYTRVEGRGRAAVG